MLRAVSKKEIEALLAKQFWPWPLALAYLQVENVAPVAAASEVLVTYPNEEGLVEFMASSAVGRIYEVVTGKPHKHDQETYWSEVAELEKPLVGALEAGQIRAFGREARDKGLSPVAAIDWVGSEVSPERTSDLVVEGWRKTDLLGQALGSGQRRVRAYDLHLEGSAIQHLRQSLESADARDKIHEGSYEEIEALEQAEVPLRRGYWSPLVAGAWIASRSQRFTSAIQLFERQRHCERGHAHSWTAWLTVGDLMGKRFGMTLTGALDLLREALETGNIAGGKGVSGPTKKVRLIERHEWTQWSVAHNSGGVYVLPDTFDVAWPSEAVIEAFPPDNSVQTEVESASSDPPTEDELLTRCDELWLSGINVREIEKVVPKESRFNVIKAYNIRDLLTGRYPRIGRGGTRAPGMIRK